MSIAYTNKTGIIVRALNIPRNKHDSKTIPDVIDKIDRTIGKVPIKAGTDQGYRGISKYKECEIIHTDKLKGEKINQYERRKIKRMH